jgi:hypothetical protein
MAWFCAPALEIEPVIWTPEYGVLGVPIDCAGPLAARCVRSPLKQTIRELHILADKTDLPCPQFRIDDFLQCA